MEPHPGSLPASPNLDHLKKQAKRLLRDARAGKTDAVRRFLETLPAMRSLDAASLAQHDLKLHDAQSVVAREAGFRSWTELKLYVVWTATEKAERLATWLRWAFDGNARERGLATRTLRENPSLLSGDPWLACVIGDEARLAAALARDPEFAHRPGGPLAMPPLVAVTQSRLIQEDGFEAGLLACARLLLRHGADVNAAWTDPRFPDSPLSALYGAAGKTHHIGMTRLLLEAGADPNDGESLYHSVEDADETCTRLLLGAGARVEGSNALGRVLDYDRLDRLELLLERGGATEARPWLHHAILRGRSLAHLRALVEAGASLTIRDDSGVDLLHFALRHGRRDVVEMLRAAGIDAPLSQEERFVAACACGDEPAARAILERVPDVVARLDEAQLKTLPQLADLGEMAAVRTMLALGWPRDIKAAWDATALNLAVFRGDAAMADLLLASGADWRTPHGFGDNAIGTLSFASRADDIDPSAPRDFLGCARVLLNHGVPRAQMRRYGFAPEITTLLEDGAG